MLKNRHQHAGQGQNVNKANRSYENGANLKYLGDQNLVHEENKSILNVGNASEPCVLSFAV
jgi:hypothetical protein